MATTVIKSKAPKRAAALERRRGLRLSDPRLVGEMAELRRRLACDREFALQTLRQAGIITKTGRLARRFGG